MELCELVTHLCSRIFTTDSYKHLYRYHEQHVLRIWLALGSKILTVLMVFLDLKITEKDRGTNTKQKKKIARKPQVSIP